MARKAISGDCCRMDEHLAGSWMDAVSVRAPPPYSSHHRPSLANRRGRRSSAAALSPVMTKVGDDVEAEDAKMLLPRNGATFQEGIFPSLELHSQRPTSSALREASTDVKMHNLTSTSLANSGRTRLPQGTDSRDDGGVDSPEADDHAEPPPNDPALSRDHRQHNRHYGVDQATPPPKPPLPKAFRTFSTPPPPPSPLQSAPPDRRKVSIEDGRNPKAAATAQKKRLHIGDSFSSSSVSTLAIDENDDVLDEEAAMANDEEENEDERTLRDENEEDYEGENNNSNVIHAPWAKKFSSSGDGPPLPKKVACHEKSAKSARTSIATAATPTMHRHSSILDLGLRVKDVGKSVKMAAEDELRTEAHIFADSTTAHGIPLAINAKKWYARFLWTTLSVCSVGLFIYQCILVFNKFQRKDKIVSVELQFENAAFPAVTICSLNPFKQHLARKVPEISETLDAYHQAVIYSKDAAQQYGSSRERRSAQNPGGFRYVQFEPVMSDCECDDVSGGSPLLPASARPRKTHTDCIQKDTIPRDNISLCICNYDRQDSTVWPCYPSRAWVEALCPECNDIGYCNLPETNGTDQLPCLCQKAVNYCLLRPERLKRMWEVRGNRIPDEGSPFRADFLAQLRELGFENMTDEVAITTKTKERLILTMAALPVHRRIALSYGKSEFIRMCSFNGQQCDIINDFKLHVDPAFGNCYIFNANREKPLRSNRAGPSYGLRLLMHINASDYLPTTQASGVRIAIHSQEEWPFPDSFGYSAPTDSVSSFGISLRKVNRLPMPNGDCVPEDQPPPQDYIYRNYKYEPEGCYKSCYQNQIIRRCGCADPRYPVSNNNTNLCDSLDPLSRNCLLVEGIKFTRQHLCKCKHPCRHDVYTTTFSSAKLTPNAFRVAPTPQCQTRECRGRFDSDSAAMVEIYYEQMSYEILSESESYLFVNFMSDVGGQAGLWLGASVITVFELIVFFLRLITIFCRGKTRQAATDAVSGSFGVGGGGFGGEIGSLSGKKWSVPAGRMISSASDPRLGHLTTVQNDDVKQCTQRIQSAPDVKLVLNKTMGGHRYGYGYGVGRYCDQSVDEPPSLVERRREAGPVTQPTLEPRNRYNDHDGYGGYDGGQ